MENHLRSWKSLAIFNAPSTLLFFQLSSKSQLANFPFPNSHIDWIPNFILAIESSWGHGNGPRCILPHICSQRPPPPFPMFQKNSNSCQSSRVLARSSNPNTFSDVHDLFPNVLDLLCSQSIYELQFVTIYSLDPNSSLRPQFVTFVPNYAFGVHT